MIVTQCISGMSGKRGNVAFVYDLFVSEIYEQSNRVINLFRLVRLSPEIVYVIFRLLRRGVLYFLQLRIKIINVYFVYFRLRVE